MRLRHIILFLLMAVFITPIRASIHTDYLLGGALTLKNGRIDKCYFEGGFARAFETSATTDRFVFYYYNQDHLGNNREVVNASGNVQQITNYYPFGAPYADPKAVKGSALQPYKYNGKELDLMHGLNTYDYGARQYNPILARWDRVDPLAEKDRGISPYVYCRDNPINAIDPDGKFSWILAGALVGAAIEGGTAYYEGKTPREIMGASAKGFIEGAAMCIPYGSAITAVASSAGAGAVGNISEQFLGTGEIKTDEVFKSSVSGALSGGVGHVTSQAITKGAALAEKTIEQKYSSDIFQKSIRKEIQLEMKQSGRMTSGKSARQAVKKATAHRIGVLKEAEKRELDITSKAADYIQQQTNGNASDWIINGVFNKGKNK